MEDESIFIPPTCQHLSLAGCYEELRNLLISKGVRLPLKTGDPQSDLINLNQTAIRYLSSSKDNSAKGYPNGNWYMVTVTTPSDRDESHAREIHNQAMTYFKYKGVKVAHATLEKSNIYHIHYVANIPENTLNFKRDLSSACNKYRVAVERKVTNLHMWNGLCKYVQKIGYSEKGETHVATLVNGISKVEGQGYVLNNS